MPVSISSNSGSLLVRAGDSPPPAARIGKFRLRIFVEILHVGVRRRGVEIEVILLDVFAVVALVARQAEQPLLQNRVAAIPEGQCKADELMAIGDAADAILAPAVRAADRA